MKKYPVWFRNFVKTEPLKVKRNIKFWRYFFVITYKNYIYRRKNRLTREQLRAKINHPVCDCGHTFNISWPVIYRLVNCPVCRRSYWYERDLKMNYTFEKLGKFKNKTEFEKELEDYGKSR